MGQTPPTDDAKFARSGQDMRTSGKSARATSRRKQPRPLSPVPMLDWPSDLFSDNVIMAETFPVQFTASGTPFAQQDQAIHLWAA